MTDNHIEFFKEHGETEISVRDHEGHYSITINDLYVMFKERMKAEEAMNELTRLGQQMGDYD